MIGLGRLLRGRCAAKPNVPAARQAGTGAKRDQRDDHARGSGPAIVKPPYGAVGDQSRPGEIVWQVTHGDVPDVVATIRSRPEHPEKPGKPNTSGVGSTVTETLCTAIRR